jgi:HK97 family phage portal protein
MAIFSNLKAKWNQWVQKRADSTIVTLGSGGSYSTDDPYNDSKALKIATLYRCLNIKASAVASMGMNLRKRKNFVVNGVSHQNFVIADNDILNYVLSFKANSKMTAFDLLFNLTIQIDLYGNAYVLPTYRNGEIYELILLDPLAVVHDIYRDVYSVSDQKNNIFAEIGESDIIHIRNFCTDGGYQGVSTLQFAANTLGISYATDTQQEDMFKNGSTLRGFVSGDQSTVQGFGQAQDKQLADVSDRVETQLRSGKRIFSLPGIMRFNQLSLSPADLQLLDSKKFSCLEICRFFGVHPDKVFQSTSTNYKASENSQTVFMTDTLQPLIRRIETEFNSKLFDMMNLRKYRITFNLDKYYEADIISKADYYQKMEQAGALTPNEIRAREGREPVEGGDCTFISCNVAPIMSAKITGETTETSSPSQEPEEKDNDNMTDEEHDETEGAEMEEKQDNIEDEEKDNEEQ